ncbi:MAG: threonylcarbamoyl-AMP synthase [Betaproteobacteria bacterium]|nr:threonylcarbamoyl-AMP synthase [Betaproteobacteria bacterium]
MAVTIGRDIAHAVAILRRGGLVAFPTETVYGLGADARNAEAVGRIYAAKGRPPDHPVIVHLAGAAQLADWADDVTPLAKKLADKFWPGPLTLILHRAAGVGDFVTGGQDSVGLRVPAHPVAQDLLKAFGGGIAAPSANRFGRVSTTTARHVAEELGDRVDYVLDGGASDIGIESTIIDARGSAPVLMRPGHISVPVIEAAAGVVVAAPRANAPRVSGALAAHYAPATTLLLLEADLLLELAATLSRQGKRCAVLAMSARQPLLDGLTWIAAPADAAAYAHELYANLRALDAAACEAILVEQPPQQTAWAAVNDRLMRAAAGARLNPPV